MKNYPDFAGLVEGFFTERLVSQRSVSPLTIRSYCDAFRLMLTFAQERIGKPPSDLKLADLNAAFVSKFLDHREKHRHNSARTRNARLAAIRSFFRYAAMQCPEHCALIQRVLVIPSKRFIHREIAFLTRPEVDALLAAPNQATWAGRRNYALLLVAVQTGLRVSELVGLRCQDAVLDNGVSWRWACLGGAGAAAPLLSSAGVRASRASPWVAAAGAGPQCKASDRLCLARPCRW